MITFGPIDQRVLTKCSEICIGLELMDPAPLGVHGQTYVTLRWQDKWSAIIWCPLSDVRFSRHLAWYIGLLPRPCSKCWDSWLSIYSSPPSCRDMSRSQCPDNSCSVGDDVFHNIQLLYSRYFISSLMVHYWSQYPCFNILCHFIIHLLDQPYIADYCIS